MSKGGDTTTTSSTSSLPKEVAPYYTDLLKRAQTVSKQPYTAYGGDRLTDFSADTNSAFDMIRGIAGEGTPGIDSAMGTLEGIAGYEANPITAGNVTADNVGARDVTAGSVTAGTTNPTGLAQYIATTPGSVASSNVTTGNFNFQGIPQANISAYMSPYTQNVLDVQRTRANQSFAEQQAGRDAAAVAAGAFGGDRRFVSDSLAQRDLNQQLQEMDATGLAAAFDRATGLFQSDEARRLSAYEGDAGRRLTADTGNADRRLSAQEFNVDKRLASDVGNADRRLASSQFDITTRLGSDIANVDRQLSANTANVDRRLAAQTANANRQLQAATSNADRRLSAMTGNADRGLNAAVASEDARLRGRSLGLDAATQLGVLEGQRRDLDLGAAEALSGVGAKIQQRDQAGLDIAYQDFLNQRDWPSKQLSLYSQLLSGTPVNPSTTTTTTEPAPDFLSQLVGAGTGIAGLMRLLQG